jgi:hypothetical protein
MVIEAPICKFKKTNLKIYIGACIIFAVVFAYDGYISKYPWSYRQGFYNKHVKDGKPDDTMMFQRIVPLFLAALAAGLICYLGTVKNKKIIADEEKLTIDEKTDIIYDSIEKVDKTKFDSKGFFLITYKDASNTDKELKLSNRRYDNLTAVLEKIVDKIS